MCLRLIALFCSFYISCTVAHDKGKVTYLGNEALLVESGDSKLLFDPFFHNHFNTYTLVPNHIRKQIFAKEAPFNNIKAIFVSHAHGDHFSETDTLRYLQENTEVSLIAPQQAIEMMKTLNGFSKLKNKFYSIDLKFKESAKTFDIEELQVEAVRIPHAGWPQRADVQNIVYRVASRNVTVMHMGDADVDSIHYQIHQDLWEKKPTNMAFPPYWFFYSEEGNHILEHILNIDKSVGIHVPTNTPKGLNDTGKDFFITPGESRKIINFKAHALDLSKSNECGNTIGYKFSSEEVTKLLTLYSDKIEWGQSTEDRLMNDLLRKHCKGNYKIYEKLNSLVYFDGCIKAGNASGETTWEYRCTN